MSPAPSIHTAISHLEAGRLAEAESACLHILQTAPNDATALQVLGVVQQNQGRAEAAVETLQRAVAGNPNEAGAHLNLGIACYHAGDPGVAVGHFRAAIKLAPNIADAHYNLGVALRAIGDSKAAADSYRKAVAVDPGFAAAHFNLGNLLNAEGRGRAALVSYRTAAALQPTNPNAHVALGLLCQDLGEIDAAVDAFQAAVGAAPDHADAHHYLGGALIAAGKDQAALLHHLQAVRLSGEDTHWHGLARACEWAVFGAADAELLRDLSALLERNIAPPAGLARAVLSALRHHAAVRRAVELGTSGQPISVDEGMRAAEALSAVPLLLQIMRMCPLPDRAIEDMLSGLRQTMLRAATEAEVTPGATPFLVALAMQCFINEYVFPLTDEERAGVDTLEADLTRRFAAGDPPAASVLVLGCYRPLHLAPWAEAYADAEAAAPLADVVRLQISEPLIERRLMQDIPALTGIGGGVTAEVRAQYEQSPYPRWLAPPPTRTPRPVADILQSPPLAFEVRGFSPAAPPRILVAGCGTGQHAAYVAMRYADADVLAIDLSLASLAYARRRTAELGLTNIRFAHADILALGDLPDRFDVIESIGVLHHMADPVAGWRMLTGLLKPKGVIKIGLYSALGRRNVLAGRALIAEQGWTGTADEIRRGRAEIFSRADAGDAAMAAITAADDFYSLSECRDLLFHVHEHNLSLPDIDDAVRTLGLRFLGFEFSNERAMRAFTALHPKPKARASLSLWHKFEQAHPDTFREMYQFWCQKP